MKHRLEPGAWVDLKHPQGCKLSEGGLDWAGGCCPLIPASTWVLPSPLPRNWPRAPQERLCKSPPGVALLPFWWLGPQNVLMPHWAGGGGSREGQTACTLLFPQLQLQWKRKTSLFWKSPQNLITSGSHRPCLVLMIPLPATVSGGPQPLPSCGNSPDPFTQPSANPAQWGPRQPHSDMGDWCSGAAGGCRPGQCSSRLKDSVGVGPKSWGCLGSIKALEGPGLTLNVMDHLAAPRCVPRPFLWLFPWLGGLCFHSATHSLPSPAQTSRNPAVP